jgi:lipopolysaccharide export system protein LptA
MRPFPIPSLYVLAGLAAVFLLCTAPAGAQNTTNAFGGLSENSDEPIDIASDELTLYTDDYALFRGNVKAVQGGTTLRARELKVHFLGHGTGGSDSAGATNEEAKKPAATNGETAKRKGGAGPQNGTKPPAEPVKDTQPASADQSQPANEDPINIQSDWLLVHDKEKYAQFKGNVRVVRGETKLRSKELLVNFAGDDSLSVVADTSESAVTTAKITKIVAKGGVRALLTPKESAGGKSAKGQAQATARAAPSSGAKPGLASASKGPAGAKAQGGTPGGGEVKAMAPSNVPASSQSAGPQATENRQISKLEATGEVVITSDKDETSTSDWAIYNLPSESVTIGGNVVLTQKETVLKGDRLVIDLKTGESRFENTGTAATGGRRIRALFMPKDGGGKNKKPAGSESGTTASPQPTERPQTDDTEPLPLVPEFR